MKKSILVFLAFGLGIVLIVTSVFAQDAVNTATSDDFRELSKTPELNMTYKSLKVLARVSHEYRMQVDVMVGFSLEESATISLQQNPFYIDNKDEYQKIIDPIRKAKEISDVGEELERILRVAEWRVTELAESQTATISPGVLEQADTEEALKKIIAESSGQTRALAKEKLENLIIDRVQKKPTVSALVIPEIQPLKESYRAKISVVSVSAGGEFALFSTDRYPHDGPLELGSSWMGIFPLGDGSVHRYEVEYSPSSYGKYKFIGNKEDPLTFVLLDGVGYVYLYGRGKVIMPDGKEVILPPIR